MTRATKHPLNRYAKPILDQIDHCHSLAPVLAAGMQSRSQDDLAEACDACGSFALHVAERISWASSRGEEAATVHYLEWMNAMAVALKTAGIRAPEKNAEYAFLIGYHLHGIPLWLSGQSILNEIKRNLPPAATWQHLINLSDAVTMRTGHPPLRIIPANIKLAQTRANLALIPFSDHATINVPSIAVLQGDIVYNRAICMHFLEDFDQAPMSARRFKSHIRGTLLGWEKEAAVVLAKKRASSV